MVRRRKQQIEFERRSTIINEFLANSDRNTIYRLDTATSNPSQSVLSELCAALSWKNSINNRNKLRLFWDRCKEEILGFPQSTHESRVARSANSAQDESEQVPVAENATVSTYTSTSSNRRPEGTPEEANDIKRYFLKIMEAETEVDSLVQRMFKAVCSKINSKKLFESCGEDIKKLFDDYKIADRRNDDENNNISQ